MTNLPFLSATEILEALRRRRFRSVELVRAYLERIVAQDDHWHAYVDVYAESALEQARPADARRDSGLPVPPLLGLPISLKDCFEIEGRIATCGSAAWHDRVSPQTSQIVLTLLAAGAILLGKTHMGEFCYGGWGINPEMGTPRNPWGAPGEHHAPGGSSSGAAVSVAAGLGCAAIGTDTGGSVRVPAALAGLTGFKPTYAAVDTTGSLPMCPSLDSIGVIARSVADARLLFQAMTSTRSPHLATVSRSDSGFPEGRRPALRIAYLPPENYPCPVDAAVIAAHEAMLATFDRLGAGLQPVNFPFDIPAMMKSSDDIILAEAYSIHSEHIDQTDKPFGPWVARRIRSGHAITAHRYLQAREQRRRWTALYWRHLQDFDAYLIPVAPGVAPPLRTIDEDRTTIGMFTRLVNYVGACALSIPAGFDEAGLPVGMQLVGRPGDDWALLDIGEQIQGVTSWHSRVPPSLLPQAG